MLMGRPDWWAMSSPSKTLYAENESFFSLYEATFFGTGNIVYLCNYTVPDDTFLHLAHWDAWSLQGYSCGIGLMVDGEYLTGHFPNQIISFDYTASGTLLLGPGQNVNIMIDNSNGVLAFCGASIHGFQEIRI